MRLSRFYVDTDLKLHQSLLLDVKLSHYLIRVLRLKQGDNIILFNGQSEHDFLSTIIYSGKMVEVAVNSSTATHFESPLTTSILQALSKNEHLDFTIQKCTELGVSNIVIFNSERTQSPLKNNKLEKKLLHWQRIARSACEQCGRSMVPKISFNSELLSTLQQSEADAKIMLDFSGISLQQQMASSLHSVDILLGAEGGLTEKEIELAQNHDFHKTSLGHRVLRTETAAISALAIIQALIGDLN